MIDELSFQNPSAVGGCLATRESVAVAAVGIAEEFAGCFGPFEAAAACCYWISTAEAGLDCQVSYTNDWKI